MKYVCCPSPTQLTDAKEDKKKPPFRDETDTVTLEMVQWQRQIVKYRKPIVSILYSTLNSHCVSGVCISICTTQIYMSVSLNSF